MRTTGSGGDRSGPVHRRVYSAKRTQSGPVRPAQNRDGGEAVRRAPTSLQAPRARSSDWPSPINHRVRSPKSPATARLFTASSSSTSAIARSGHLTMLEYPCRSSTASNTPKRISGQDDDVRHARFVGLAQQTKVDHHGERREQQQRSRRHRRRQQPAQRRPGQESREQRHRVHDHGGGGAGGDLLVDAGQQ